MKGPSVVKKFISSRSNHPGFTEIQAHVPEYLSIVQVFRCQYNINECNYNLILFVKTKTVGAL